MKSFVNMFLLDQLMGLQIKENKQHKWHLPRQQRYAFLNQANCISRSKASAINLFTAVINSEL